MVEETLEAKLKRHEDALVACMAEITKLREENARLRSSENNAHSVLREVYNDPSASPAVRVKAAGLALPHETPRLESVPPPLELVAEPVEPLAEVVRRQRARADRMLREDPQFQAWRDSHLLEGNGSDNTES
jgi:hypothetical protein